MRMYVYWREKGNEVQTFRAVKAVSSVLQALGKVGECKKTSKFRV